jgi:hypothetical protein
MANIYHINGAIVSASAFLDKRAQLQGDWAGGEVTQENYGCGNCEDEPTVEMRTISYVNRHNGVIPFDSYYDYCSVVGRSIEGIQAWASSQPGFVPGSIQLVDPYPGQTGTDRPTGWYVIFTGGCGHIYTGAETYPVFDKWECHYQVVIS